jgi:bifunctional DNA-binding transcriptional regulator/antitoxin component of YhaV-PrlF toxin-antitoxin module
MKDMMVPIDQAGRIVLPKDVREAAQFLFCKIFEHQTEGGFWLAMLR